MCKWGTQKLLKVTIPAKNSHTGVAQVKEVPIDSCIYDIVKLLNEKYKLTAGSCCGHGKSPASIIFHDGTEIVIMTQEQSRNESLEEARRIIAKQKEIILCLSSELRLTKKKIDEVFLKGIKIKNTNLK